MFSFYPGLFPQGPTNPDQNRYTKKTTKSISDHTHTHRHTQKRPYKINQKPIYKKDKIISREYHPEIKIFIGMNGTIQTFGLSGCGMNADKKEIEYVVDFYMSASLSPGNLPSVRKFVECFAAWT